MIYLLSFVYLAFLAFVYDFGGARTGRKLNYWTALILLVLIAGFRYKVGGDTRNYMYSYQYIPPLSGLLGYGDTQEKIQPLWLLFSSLAKTFSSSFYALQIMQALVVNICVFIFFKRVTKYYFTAILIYAIGAYPYFNFEIMREALAIGLFLCAYPAYRDARWKTYYVLTAIAFLLHASAFILFFLPLLRRRQPPIVFAPIVFVVGILFQPLLRGYLSGGGSLGWMLSYASTYDDYTATVHGLISLFVLFVIFPMLLIKASGLASEKGDPIIALAITGIWIGATTSLFFIFFRFLNYFTPVYMAVACVAAHRIYRMRGTGALRALVTGVALFAVFTVYSFRYFSDTSNLVHGSRWYSRWYPYYSVLDQREDPAREALLDTDTDQ